ncbi:MAG: type IX secretion system sortase PorU [Ignavibacterium sp.]|jgi:hypothetical protein|nr:type IX secretion system sortase PorU [Ignavibacterium sp.]
MKSKISIILFLITTSFIYPQSDVRILSSDFNSVIIEYSPFYIDTSIVSVEGQQYRKTEFLFASIKNNDHWGSPMILERRLSVGVPSEFGNTIEIISFAYKELAGSLIPVPTPVFDTLSISYQYKQSSDYLTFRSPEEIVEFGEFGMVREIASQTIKINPVRFEPLDRKIRLYTKILFRINFSKNAVISSIPAGDFLDGVILNYDVAKYWNHSVTDKHLNKKVTANSVLSTGKWIRFETETEGIYKIGKSELSLYGIDVNTVDPRTIKIYNNSGKALPELNSALRPDDLNENAILVVGEEDGRFDDNDYILFYGRGNSFWDIDSDNISVKRFFNPYSAKNYFWITSGGQNGKRMQIKTGLIGTANYTQTNTVAFADWEIDRINIGKTGRQSLGDNFSASIVSRSYTNNLNGRIDTTQIKYNFRFVVAAPSAMNVNITENGTSIFQQNLAGYSGDYRVGNQHLINAVFNNPLSQNRSVLTITANPSTVSTILYLDYFTIEYQKELQAFSDKLLFFSKLNTGITEYKLNGFTSSNIKVFDITDYANVKLVNNYSMLSGGECWFQFEESASARTKYFALGNDNFNAPINPIEIQNSNLRGEEIGAKFIIITHKDFKEAANILKNYRETKAQVPISTYVADIEQIYNEFSGGLLDPTALRDYLKFAYENWQIKPEYVLLFGKGTYDYKNLEGYSDNFVPTWQTVESNIYINGGNSFTTDDYFVRIVGIDDKVDLALGRITCATPAEANIFVNKIINYEQNSEKGLWRNLITLVADDGLKSDGTYEGSEHTDPCEKLANIYFPGSFNFNKIYSAAYPDVITGQGRRKPEVNKAIIDAINNGTLFLNYIGHGSPELWAHEVIFEKSVVLPQLNNDKYFFLSAATCDFGYFDIPNYKSSAEALLFLPNSGAIATYTANRVVFSTPNHNLNFLFVQYLFKSQRDTLNLSIPIGKASLKYKEDHFTINDMKYNIFGDPTLRLHIPQYFSSIDSVNGQNLAVDVQIQALSKAVIKGTILKPDNTPWSDFNGEGTLTVFDSERRALLSQIGNYPVNIPGGVIFNGRVSVINGKFSAEFVVPKDISYENKNGKVIFYFLNNESDGLGYTNKVIIGGTDSSVVNDGKGPNIDIYFDDISANNGYLVNQNPKLIVNLSDETGLNTTGTGVGHKLEGILNNDNTNPIDFTNYFTGDLDAGGKSGTINYRFSSIMNGDYQLLVKAWDVFNNLSEEEAYFSVVDGNDLIVRDVYNYPNPFSDRTQFTFQQNLLQPIDVKIKVYSIAGRLISEIEKNSINDRFVVIDWDGRDADGDKLGNGTYFYKIIIKSTDGSFTKSVLGKLSVVK